MPLYHLTVLFNVVCYHTTLKEHHYMIQQKLIQFLHELCYPQLFGRWKAI